MRPNPLSRWTVRQFPGFAATIWLSSLLPASSRALRSLLMSLLFVSSLAISSVAISTLAIRPLVAQDETSADFRLQGEYSTAGVGLQVIAVGNGEFEFALYQGGLPGAGWDGAPPQRADGSRDTIEEIIESRKLTKITRKSPTLGARPPTGAIVLFDGTPESISRWQPGARRTDDGLLVAGATSRETFRDYTLHVEFQTPFMPKATGQARGNSGVYHQGRYETQILDSFGLEGKNNEAGGIYEIRDPDLNMCFPPLSWQTYDIDFTAPRFDASGAKVADARLTVKLNGVVVQREVSVPRTTRAAPLKEENTPGPIYLQDHGNPVRFRNIWLVPRDAEREALRPVLPGFERFFAESVQAGNVVGGRLLIGQLGCTACHSTDDADLKPKSAPYLNEVGSRVRYDHLVSFISTPQQTKPGTLMPNMLHGLPESEQAQAIKELVSLLASTGKLVDRPGDAASKNRGEKLFHSIGCVACHAPRVSAKSMGSDKSNSTDLQSVSEKEYVSTSVPLGDLTSKYTLDSLTTFLLNPHAVRPSGAMPRLASGRVEARDIACYLLGDKIIGASTQQFDVAIYHGEWDKLPDFDALTPVKKVKAASLDISLSGRRDNFAMRFDAWLPITEPGEYQFYLGSDDGSRLMIDDQEVLNADGIHPFGFRNGRRRLDTGVHRVRIDYFEKGGQEQLELEFEGPGIERSPLANFVRDSADEAALKPIIADKFQPDEKLIEAGNQRFEKLGCVNCHRLKPGETQSVGNVTGKLAGKPLNRLPAEGGCLSSTQPAAGLPDYALSPAQRLAIQAALLSISERASNGLKSNEVNAMKQLVAADEIRLHARLAALNCYACHVRNGLGGIEKNRDAYFTTRVQEMGNEARVPPPLTGVGDKLLPEVLEGIVHNGAKDRPYMVTRMPAFFPVPGSETALAPRTGRGRNRAQAPPANQPPAVPQSPVMTPISAEDQQYGKEQVASLRTWFEGLDAHAVHPASSMSLSDADHQTFIAEGRKLSGSGGLACIKCHTYGQRATPGIAAIDMLTMPQRLKPDWFHRYMLAPADYRPGTRMPLSFPDGKSVLGSVLEGNADAQIHALWLYLKEGTKAKPPVGLDGASIVLVAENKPVIYRNFIEGLGPRGIAVGYPEKLNMAWDAGTMNLVLLWKNDFIDASRHWVGRGAGKQGPLGDFVITLPDRLPLARLASIDEAWPKADARELGYRFRGYSLDPSGRPIFRYSIGDTQVEDSLTPIVESNKAVGFRRELKLTSPTALEQMVMSVATGRIARAGESSSTTKQFVIDDTLRMKIDGAAPQIVSIPSQNNAQELRVTLPGEKRVQLSLEMRW